MYILTIPRPCISVSVFHLKIEICPKSMLYVDQKNIICYLLDLDFLDLSLYETSVWWNYSSTLKMELVKH